MKGIKEKNAIYEKRLMAADRSIHNGSIAGALGQAREGFELGLELGRNECAAQYLFCLNELGRFDEAAQAAERYMGFVKPEAAAGVDDAVLSNALCAMLAFGTEKAGRVGMELLKKSGLASVNEWRRRFAAFDYNPVQTSLVFNAALVFSHAGQKAQAEQLLKEVMEHMIFFIDSQTNGERNISEEEAETISKFLELLGAEFAQLKEAELWRELAEIAEHNI
ncbi:MAG: hypothetical protein LBT84_05865 [Spirochaetia bacterium]|jgi:hypothetical protein|nr:hypothetical protein [Spirochaetia bacterium]